jgi:flagellar basal-body rod protein FlgF
MAHDLHKKHVKMEDEMPYDISDVASAMDQKIVQLDYMTNNLANATTPGYKAIHLHALENMKEGATEPQPANSAYVDFSKGMPQSTGNPLDLCIQSDGFFVVQTSDGQAFTRKGDFTVNKSHQIVTQSGDPVLGDGGAITLRDGRVQILNDGSVYVDETQVGKLRIVDFTDRKALSNAGSGLYRDSGKAGIKKVDRPDVASGFIELSNVNVVKEMADMIDIQRTFENYQKIIQTQSELDKLSTSRVGRIA